VVRGILTIFCICADGFLNILRLVGKIKGKVSFGPKKLLTILKTLSVTIVRNTAAKILTLKMRTESRLCCDPVKLH
jgi:hypothetical protein